MDMEEKAAKKGPWARVTLNAHAGAMLRVARGDQTPGAFKNAILKHLGMGISEYGESAYGAWERGDNPVPAAALLAAIQISGTGLDRLAQLGGELLSRQQERQQQRLRRLRGRRFKPPGKASGPSSPSSQAS